MAKGKHAAKRSVRLLAEAEQKIESLDHELAAEKEQHMSDVQKLKTEIHKLEGRLIRDVDNLAADKIRETERRYQQTIDEIELEHRNQVESVINIIRDGNVKMSMYEYERMAEALGIQVGEIFTSDKSRRVRRMTTKRARAIRTMDDQGQI